jgi:hypothetical protein
MNKEKRMPRPVTVDFTGVEAGFTSVKVPEGDYAWKVTKVVSKKAASSGNPCLVFELLLTAGPKGGIGKKIPHNCTLTKASLWNLRNLIESTGRQVPSKALKLDLDKMVGWTGAGTVIDDEYEGKKKSVFSAFFPISELSSEPEVTGTASAEAEESEEGDELGEGGDESESGEEEETLFE